MRRHDHVQTHFGSFCWNDGNLNDSHSAEPVWATQMVKACVSERLTASAASTAFKIGRLEAL